MPYSNRNLFIQRTAFRDVTFAARYLRKICAINVGFSDGFIGCIFVLRTQLNIIITLWLPYGVTTIGHQKMSSNATSGIAGEK